MPDEGLQNLSMSRYDMLLLAEDSHAAAIYQFMQVFEVIYGTVALGHPDMRPLHAVLLHAMFITLARQLCSRFEPCRTLEP